MRQPIKQCLLFEGEWHFNGVVGGGWAYDGFEEARGGTPCVGLLVEIAEGIDADGECHVSGFAGRKGDFAEVLEFFDGTGEDRTCFGDVELYSFLAGDISCVSDGYGDCNCVVGYEDIG